MVLLIMHETPAAPHVFEPNNNDLPVPAQQSPEPQVAPAFLNGSMAYNSFS